MPFNPAAFNPAAFNPVAFTRQLVDIPSITGDEAACGEFLLRELATLGLDTRRMEVDANPAHPRFNVLATWPGHPEPAIVFSTHFDTVPPFLGSSEDDANVYGRGSCDAKGILAAQVAACLRLHDEGLATGLLFVVDEESQSEGARVANKLPIGSKFLINGEPTDNRLGLASKGTLLVELVAEGRAAHSAYPELGESAIEKLLDALARVRDMALPVEPEAGLTTGNIGLIEGGRASNVIPDHAKATLLYRLVGDATQLRRDIETACEGLVRVNFVRETPYIRMKTFPGLPTMVAAFTTDIPKLTNWGEPLLIGPGSIHVAHTRNEFLAKAELLAAVDIYCDLARRLSSDS